MLDVCMQSLLCVLYWNLCMHVFHVHPKPVWVHMKRVTDYIWRKTISMNPGWKNITVFKFCPHCDTLRLMRSLPRHFWYPPALSSPFSALARSHTASEVEKIVAQKAEVRLRSPGLDRVRKSCDRAELHCKQTKSRETIKKPSVMKLFPVV